jgi:hypothetical protein
LFNCIESITDEDILLDLPGMYLIVFAGDKKCGDAKELEVGFADA